MALALLLMVVLGNLYINSFTSQLTDSRNVALEHGARNAFTVLVRDIPSAGYANGATMESLVTTGMSVTDDCSGIASAIDMKAGFLAGRGTSASIKDCVSDAKTGDYTSTFKTPTDWVLVKGAIGEEIAEASLAASENYMISGVNNGKVFRTASTDPKAPGGIKDGVIRKYGFSLFYITKDDQLALLQLSGAGLVTKILAENVEAMRVRVGKAADNESGVTQLIGLSSTTDGWTAAEWNTIRSIELSILATTEVEPGYSDTREYKMGDVKVKAVSASQNRRRKLLTQTVYLYNLSYGQTQ